MTGLQYADPDHNGILRSADGAWIPCDPENRDYADIIASEAEIAPYVQPPPEPIVVSRLAAKLALQNAGLLERADAAVAQFALQAPAVSLFWNESEAFVENNIYVQQLAPAIGLTPDQTHALFVAAKAIQL